MVGIDEAAVVVGPVGLPCWLAEFGCEGEGPAVVHDEWNDKYLCRAHGVMQYLRRLSTATESNRKKREVGLSGEGLSCDCSLAVTEADLDNIRRLMCEFCRQAIDAFLTESDRRKRGERNDFLGMVLAVSSPDLRGFSRLRYLSGMSD